MKTAVCGLSTRFELYCMILWVHITAVVAFPLWSGCQEMEVPAVVSSDQKLDDSSDISILDVTACAARTALRDVHWPRPLCRRAPNGHLEVRF